MAERVMAQEGGTFYRVSRNGSPGDWYWEVMAALENCRALVDQIEAALSAEEPVVDVSTAEELLLHLERAASALDSALKKPPALIS
jgi:hypothetical protein